MKRVLRSAFILLVTSTLVFSPRLVQLALAQDDAASSDEVTLLQQLAKDGYLGDKKDFYLSAKNLTEDDITDGLLILNDLFSKTDLKSLQPGMAGYPLGDLQALLKLVEDKADDIRDRKVSAWKFENRLKKMIVALTPSAEATPAEESNAAATVVATPTAPQPTFTATPVPGPSRADWDDMKGTVKDLEKKTADLQDAYEKKIDALQKTNDQLTASNADAQEQLKLVKNLLDRVQDDLNKTTTHLDEVEKKASEKSITDTELQQELTIMHKDLRDNSQDVGILKEEVVKLSKADTQEGQSPLDQFLNSKWLAGGALAVGLTALVVSLTRK